MARKGPRTWRSHAILLPGDNSIGTVSPLGRAVDLPIDCLTSVGLLRYSVPLTNKQALFPNLTKNMTNKVRERMDDKPPRISPHTWLNHLLTDVRG